MYIMGEEEQRNLVNTCMNNNTVLCKLVGTVKVEA